MPRKTKTKENPFKITTRKPGRIIHDLIMAQYDIRANPLPKKIEKTIKENKQLARIDDLLDELCYSNWVYAKRGV